VIISIFIIMYECRPGPSTSTSTAPDRTEQSEQSEVQNIPTKRSKSSTLDEAQLKRKKDGNLNIYSSCLYHVT